jgi:hypothetical protein
MMDTPGYNHIGWGVRKRDLGLVLLFSDLMLDQ